MQGNFTSKEDAIQCFDSIVEFTTLEKRELAPYVHSSATEEEYLKKLSHVGEKMILRKVNIIDKKAYEDKASVLISYKAPPPDTGI